MSGNSQLGRRGEQIATRWLEEHGYTILERNWRCPRGEIDVVSTIGESIVFVEVKTRSTLDYGHPFEAITAAKKARLRQLAVMWTTQSTLHSGLLRIDAIGILNAWSRTPCIQHLEGIA